MLILADQFAQQGHEVSLIVADATGPLRAQVPSNVELIDLRAGRMFKSIIPLSIYLRRCRPDVLLSTLEHANLVAILASFFARSRTRVYLREANTLSRVLPSHSGLKSKLMRALIRALYPRAEGIIAVSNGVGTDLQKFVQKPLRLRTIYNPVVTRDFFGRREGPPPHRWLEPGEPPVVIAIGRLTKQKNYPLLLRACANAFQESSGRLLILGDGNERNTLENLADTLGIKPFIDFVGFVPDPLPFLARAHVYVLSSDWEGLPNALIEALACRVPVISTDCPSGPREILEDGLHGSLVPCGDLTALTRAVVRALDGSHPVPMESASHRFSAKVAAKSYLDFMEFRP